MSAARLPLAFGAGCRIRPWAPARDAADLLRHADNPNVPRFLSTRFPHPYTAADAQAWFDFVAVQAPATNWAIEVDGAAAGGIGLRLGRDEFAHSAELGYWLGEAHWGRGIVSAAVAALLPWAEQSFGLRRVAAYVATGNPASLRVLEKNGFQREGLLRMRAIRDGIAQDHVALARIR
ncbi:GNAT family N-acetyltransferase [Coralloluteibacterium stylophorae]|uniref:GNAT family N-acetyltransferase n=1 Tax=Coralloluteibacterium stylophorae TaxID=1776034 RepID=A0A8J7VSW6_9GAMM|nr:GNAT family N-acetyltransferase [Coralloluteibacterium stylophorae]MBS7458877.1 GNAT family N-acetyltransferase [Coralloluteibacterium stylophorae]